MTVIKACLFDLDGVIVDTAKYHYRAWRNIANRFEVDFTEEANEQLKGVSRIDSLEIILKMGAVHMTQPDKEKYLYEKNQLYLEFVNNMGKEEILPGVSTFLQDLQEKNIKIGLGSASKNAKSILKQVGLLNAFETIVDGNGVINGKPNPEVFQKGAANLNTHPKETIVFEDSQKGVTAANTGGFISVGIGRSESLGHARLVIPGFSNMTFDRLIIALNEMSSTNA